MHKRKISSILKVEVRKMLDQEKTVEDIAKRFFLSVQGTQNIIDELEREDAIAEAISSMRKLEAFQKAHIAYTNRQEELCKTCRWRPCVGAPVCYRRVIDRDK